MNTLPTVLQEAQQREYHSPVGGFLHKLSYDQLCCVEQNLHDLPPEKSAHVLALHQHTPMVPSGQYPHDLTHQEAEMLNKVSSVDHAARQLTRQQMSAEITSDHDSPTKTATLNPDALMAAIKKKLR